MVLTGATRSASHSRSSNTLTTCGHGCHTATTEDRSTASRRGDDPNSSSSVLYLHNGTEIKRQDCETEGTGGRGERRNAADEAVLCVRTTLGNRRNAPLQQNRNVAVVGAAVQQYGVREHLHALLPSPQQFERLALSTAVTRARRSKHERQLRRTDSDSQLSFRNAVIAAESAFSFSIENRRNARPSCDTSSDEGSAGRCER